MKWLSYGWTFLVNCFYIAIILWVFERLGTKPAAIIVAVLGLIYVTIRTIAIGQFLYSIAVNAAIDRELIKIRKLLNDPDVNAYEESLPAVEEIVGRRRVKIYIDGCFLTLISLICLLVLFGQLGA